MTDQAHDDTTSPSDALIRERQNAVIARIATAPEKARSVIRTADRDGDGLACRVTRGKFDVAMGLSADMGGEYTGPSPGLFARTAIAGFGGIAVKMLAARGGVHVVRVDVEVETDFDDAARIGIGPGSAAFTETRVSIDIIARTLAMDPWFLALRDPQTVATPVAVAAPDR